MGNSLAAVRFVLRKRSVTGAQHAAEVPTRACAGVVEAGWTEEGDALSRQQFQLIIDGHRVNSTPDNLQRCIQMLYKKLKVRGRARKPSRVPWLAWDLSGGASLSCLWRLPQRGTQLLSGRAGRPWTPLFPPCLSDPAAAHRVQNEPDSWPFLKPVSKEEVPDYYDIIKVRCRPAFKRGVQGKFPQPVRMSHAQLCCPVRGPGGLFHASTLPPVG